MATPTARTDRDVLNETAATLRDAYDNPLPGGTHPDDLIARRRDSHIDTLLAECRRRCITPRQLASHARVPGRWLIAMLDRLEDRARAYEAEIHHLERELAAVRAARAMDVWRHRNPLGPGAEKQMTKVALSEVFRVSRPTIDGWLEDARHALDDNRINPADSYHAVDDGARSRHDHRLYSMRSAMRRRSVVPVWNPGADGGES